MIEIEIFLGSDYGMIPPDKFFWWARFSGCLPDGEASGPFDSAQEAEDDARNVDLGEEVFHLWGQI